MTSKSSKAGKNDESQDDNLEHSQAVLEQKAIFEETPMHDESGE